jgi:hypothetical protein
VEHLTKLEREIINIGLSRDPFTYKDLESLTSKYGEKCVYQCCEALYKNDYLSHCVIADDGIPFYMTLSHEARSYAERHRIERIEFFKRSILCPILVSVATTLLVLLIQWLLR